MKNKFLILTLCFTVLISSLNIKRSYADGGVISLPVLGVVTSLAVATGIAINSNDDLYNIGYGFVEYIKDKNQTISDVMKIFTKSVSVMGDMIKVETPFLDIVKDYFDNVFGTTNSDIVLKGHHIHPNFIPFVYGDYGSFIVSEGSSQGYSTFSFLLEDGTYKELEVNISPEFYESISFGVVADSPNSFRLYQTRKSDGKVTYNRKTVAGHTLFYGGTISIPYQGGYDWSDVESNKKDDSLSLPIPNNLGNLVGQSKDEFWDNSSDLVGNGELSLPSVDNPSIEFGGATTFPLGGTVDTPVETPNDSILDKVVSLVVPSSTYWSDTFDTFFTNVGNAFPMLDVTRFKDLCINGVPPKDIEVTIMGAKGKIFNTQYLNSIIGWLQPIVSAFMAFLLMLYNYRKVYKLIRGFEPFSGIADGNSVGEVRGKMDGAMPEMGGSSFVGPSTASTWSDGQSITRGSIQSKYYGRDI